MNRKLILEDGKTFVGEAFGSLENSIGEVVFYTGMTGYQEILSDPAYCNHIVVMTSPSIGVYGLNRDDFEAITPFIHGVIAKEVVTEPSNFRSHMSIDEFMKKHQVPGISGIDTRMLTTYLRTHGPMRGYIVHHKIETVEEAKQLLTQDNELLVKKTSKTRPYTIPGEGKRIVVIDLGIKQTMLRELVTRNFHITVVPYDYHVEAILNFQPDGVFISSGPGDPQLVTETIETIKALLGKVPLFAIGLGHQLFALACGARTKKLNVTQYGNNYPVKDIHNDQTWITTKSSSYTVDEASIKDLDLKVTYRSINDGAIEGLAHKKYVAFSTQFHPEGAPGSSETAYLFDQFLNMIENNQKNGGQNDA